MIRILLAILILAVAIVMWAALKPIKEDKARPVWAQGIWMWVVLGFLIGGILGLFTAFSFQNKGEKKAYVRFGSQQEQPVSEGTK